MGVRWGLGRDREVWGIFYIGSGSMHIFFVNTPFCCIFVFYAHYVLWLMGSLDCDWFQRDDEIRNFREFLTVLGTQCGWYVILTGIPAH